MTPLYLGRTGSFVQTVRDMDQAGVEQQIEALCAVFEETKEHAVNNWNQGGVS
jgi:hypothetical protein